MLRQVGGYEFLLKISAYWKYVTLHRPFHAGGWCITQSTTTLTDDSTIAAIAMVGKSSTPYRAIRTATARAAHAACIARSGSCPAACILRAASAQTSRLALRRTCNRVLGGLVATVTFNCDPHAPFPISPSLNAADLTEIWARYARS